MSSARTWGLGGLLGFELLVVLYTLQGGVSQFTLVGAAAALVLALALAQHLRGHAPPRWAWWALAALTLWRAIIQTVPFGFPAGQMPSYLVPLGFALLALRARSWQAVALIALARTWFIVWYFLGGATLLVLANVVGATGAWMWLAMEPRDGDAARADAPALEALR